MLYSMMCIIYFPRVALLYKNIYKLLIYTLLYILYYTLLYLYLTYIYLTIYLTIMIYFYTETTRLANSNNDDTT